MDRRCGKCQRKMNKLLTAETDFQRRWAGVSRIDKVSNIKVREIMRVQDKTDIRYTIEKKRLCWYGNVQ
jgi:hypothetical protein